MKQGPKPRPVAERFWEKVNITSNINQCWDWIASKNIKGYGQFCLDNKRMGAHRALWSILHGAIPEGKHILHRCDNPSCCNPTHLFMGTNADNVADRHAKGRSGTSMGKLGEKNSMAKLTQKQVDRIRLLYTLPKVTQRMLGKVFGVSNRHISRIVRNERWMA